MTAATAAAATTSEYINRMKQGANEEREKEYEACVVRSKVVKLLSWVYTCMHIRHGKFFYLRSKLPGWSTSSPRDDKTDQFEEISFSFLENKYSDVFRENVLFIFV